MPDPPSPTPAEIAERAAEIRKRWSEDERRARFTGSNRGGGRSSSGVAGPGIREYGTAADGTFSPLG